MPATPGDMFDHPTQSDGGDVRRAIPAFSWKLTEPADLYEEGWGQLSATIATSFTFSATLGGTKSDWFDGKIFFSIDGEPRHFSFSNKIINADVSGLEPGIHKVYLLAASAQGEAGRSFEFEVLDKPPSMQVGIGIDDGKLHISPDRPIPTSQLGDLSRWSIDGFLAEKRDIEVLPGNDEVIIGLTDERSFNDYMMYEPVGISPTVTFNSTLGEMKCKLFNDDRQGDRYAQSGCTWGQLYPLEQCNDAADGWTFDLQHFTSEERERREALYMLIDEGYFPNGCYYTGKYSDSWASCFNYVIVNYNWFGEGHLDPATNWYAQYDTVEYDANNCGYKGVGYLNGRWEHYDRYRGYFPPSICDDSRHQWEVIIDCNNCNGGYTYGYMSKGWIWGEDLEVDSTCPEFDEIIAIPGEMLNDYVLNTLLGDDGLPIEGFVYNANHSTSGLWQYYYDRCGYLMEDWNQDNPGGICFVVKAHDVDSNQGRWIGHMLSIDLEYKPDHPLHPGERICLEDEQMHYFYVDRDFPAAAEVDDVNEIWPLYLPDSGCSNPLPIDGSPQGELSCWIIRAGCIGEDFSSARFRIKDDCGNWTRSENVSYEGDLTIEITYPDDEIEIPENDPVTFTAEVSGYSMSPDSQQFIIWSIQAAGDNNWYSPFDTWPIDPKVIGSTVSQEKAGWRGPTFDIEHYNDCELKVKARIEICPDAVAIPDDEITVRLEGWRYVQSATTDDIAIIVDNVHKIRRDPNDPSTEYSKYLITTVEQDGNTINTQNGGAPVLSRLFDEEGQEITELDYVVRKISPRDKCIEKTLLTEVSSPTSPEDEKAGQPIEVTLYMIDDNSNRHNSLIALYNEFGIQCPEHTFFYGRGESMDVINDTPRLLIHDDPSVNSVGATEPDVQPKIYISDDEDNTKDYSIAFSYESFDDYGTELNKMYYGNFGENHKNRRGILSKNNPPADDTLICYITDVLKCGFELVQVNAGGKTAKIGIQSQGDVLFSPCHGYHVHSVPHPGEPPENPTQEQTVSYEAALLAYNTRLCIGIGPFYAGEVTEIFPQLNEQPKYIEIHEFQTSGIQANVNWLVTSACSLLSNASWSNWQQLVIDGTLDSICGFTALTRYSLPTKPSFWGHFSDEITNGPGATHSFLWHNLNVVATDPAVIAWMENACWLARKTSVNETNSHHDPLIYAAACDSNRRYVLKSKRSWSFKVCTGIDLYYIFPEQTN